MFTTEERQRFIFGRIVADPDRGRAIGLAYLTVPETLDAETREAYAAFKTTVDAQYEYVITKCGITHKVVDYDPYDTCEAMFRDIWDNARLLTMSTRSTGGRPHALLSARTNDRFRAVHDYLGHYMSGRGFDADGEEAAWVSHCMMTPDRAARRALTTETRGQNSAMNWIMRALGDAGGFPPQRPILLPEKFCHPERDGVTFRR